MSFDTNPVSVPSGGSASTTFTITVTNSSPGGSTGIDIWGSYGGIGGTQRKTSLTLVVNVPQYTLTVNTSPSGLDNPQGGGTYNQGATAQISVGNVPGYAFVKWQRDGTDYIAQQTFPYVVDASHTFTAIFAASQQTLGLLDLKIDPVQLNAGDSRSYVISVDGTCPNQQNPNCQVAAVVVYVKGINSNLVLHNSYTIALFQNGVQYQATNSPVPVAALVQNGGDPARFEMTLSRGQYSLTITCNSIAPLVSNANMAEIGVLVSYVTTSQAQARSQLYGDLAHAWRDPMRQEVVALISFATGTPTDLNGELEYTGGTLLDFLAATNPILGALKTIYDVAQLVISTDSFQQQFQAYEQRRLDWDSVIDGGYGFEPQYYSNPIISPASMKSFYQSIGYMCFDSNGYIVCQVANYADPINGPTVLFTSFSPNTAYWPIFISTELGAMQWEYYKIYGDLNSQNSGGFSDAQTRMNDLKTMLSYAKWIPGQMREASSASMNYQSGNYYRDLAALTGAQVSTDLFIAGLYTAPSSLPVAPSLLSPSNGAVGQSATPSLSWNSVQGATYYQVTVYQGSTLVWVGWPVSTSVAVPSGVLTAGVTYSWAVSAANSAGYGPASGQWTFTVSPSISQYSLSVSAGSGGTTNPPPGRYQRNVGDSMSVWYAITSAGYTFAGWSVGGASCSGDSMSNPCQFTMPSTPVSVTANFNPPTSSLSVSLISPPSPGNMGTVTSSPVTLEAQVTSSGSVFPGASVTIYVDGSSPSGCSGSSDQNGYYSCSYLPSQGSHNWNAAASKSGYNSGTSSTWSFTYSQSSHTIRFTAAYKAGNSVLRNVYYVLDGGSQVLLGTVTSSFDQTFTVSYSNSIRMFVNVNPGTVYYEELYVDGVKVKYGYVSNNGLTYPSSAPYQVTFHITPSSAGSINFPWGAYSDAQTELMDVDSLSITASGSAFSSWTSSGGVSLGSSTANPTTMTVSGAGSITANFPVRVTVYVNSEQCDATACYLVSQLSGVQVTLGSQAMPTDSSGTAVFSVPAGTYSLSVPNPVSGASGVQYAFDQWFSGRCILFGSCTNDPMSITVTSNTSYSAYLMIQYQLNMAINPFAAGTTTPPLGTHWYDAGSVVPLGVTENPGYAFTSWSGTGSVSFTGPSRQPSVTVNGPITETALLIGSSTISLNLASSTIAVGSSVTVTGSIAPAQPTGTPVVLSYGLNSGYTWSAFITTVTDSSSAYSATWYPPYSGSYQLRASWGGNANYASALSGAMSLTVTGTAPTIRLQIFGPSSATRGSPVTVEVQVTGLSSNLVANGDFSNGLAGWSVVNAGNPNYPKVGTTDARTPGNPYLYFDTPYGGNPYVDQSLTLPTGHLTLSFATWGNHDPVTATIMIVDSSGVTHVLDTFTPTPEDSYPILKSYDISPYGGQAIHLRISVTGSGSLGTIANFDNIAITTGTTTTPSQRTLFFEVIGPGGYYYFDTVKITASTSKYLFTWQIPSTAQAGNYQVVVGLIPPASTAMGFTQITIS